MGSTKSTSRVRLTSGVAAWALLTSIGFCSTAFAQDAPVEVVTDAEDDDETAVLNTVIVSGFRGSQENAIAQKRNADSIIEAISAEDIGRLPDISIAESLARLPGISSQRTNGQSSAINIRGLSQELVFSTLNGREQVVPNGQRTVEFEQFPSELISGAEVFKSPTASIIEGGLAGTVNLQTVRPLSRDGRSVTVNARGSFNDRAGESVDAPEFGYRVSASYIDQFLNDTVGVSVGYARLIQPDIATRFVGFDFNGPGADLDGDGDGDFASNGFELEELGGRERRDAIIGTLQFEPNDIFFTEIDGYYSEFESESFGRGIRVEQLAQIVTGSGVTLDNPVITDLNTLVGGTITRVGVAPIGGGISTIPDFVQGDFTTFATVFNDDNSDRDELISIGGRTGFELDRFRGAFDFTYSRAESFFRNGVTNISPIDPTIDGGGVVVLDADLVIDFQLNGTSLPDIAINQDFANLDTLALTRVGVFPTENVDELFAYAGDFEIDVDFGPISSVEFGARYSTRDAEQVRTADQIGQFNGFFQFAPDGGFGEPLGGVLLSEDITEVGSFSGSFDGFQNFLIADVPALEAIAFPDGLELNQDFGFTLTDSFIISEDVISGYLQANLDTQVGGLPVTGNVGIRIVNTDQSSSSTQFANGVALPIENGTSFTEVLPSANFIIELTDRDILRLGGSRAIARAPLVDLAANLSVGFSLPIDPVTGGPVIDPDTGLPLDLVDTNASGGGGNPLLEPFLANQGDISYEHYFDNGGIVTAAAFIKSLESFVVDGQDPAFDFVAAGASVPEGAIVVGQFNQPVNGSGGLVYGFELAYSQAFDFLPAPWDGFGAIINYSYTESEIDVPPLGAFPNNPETIPLPGLSTHVLNPTVYYEKFGFSNRLSGRFRTDFISPQVGLDEQLPNTNSEFVLDYQASYEFPEDSALAGVTLLFQANNLTDEPVTTFFGDEEATGTIQFFGRQFFFGASYTF